MRIALIHYAAPPIVGGVERVLAQQALILREHGHEVVVVCANKDSKVAGAVMEYAPNFYVKRVRSALTNCDVVIVHNMFTMPFNWESSKTLALIASEMTQTRFFNWVHDVDVFREDFTALQLKAQHIAVSAVRQGEFCKRMGLSQKECPVVPNGVDIAATLGLTPVIGAFANQHRLHDRDIVLLHPARLLARKNIELGIEITAALRESGKDVVYLVTGAPDPHRTESAEYAEAIQKLVKKRRLQDAVLFVSAARPVEDADITSLYRMADALLFPSTSEGFGLPLLEAALHRIPIFCSDIPAHREVAEKRAEFFKLTAKPAVIAKSIQAHLKNDVEGRRKREVERQYGWECIYKEYLEPLLMGRKGK
jgi:glycosyltransferase involved in cell wall biosynthesis